MTASTELKASDWLAVRDRVADKIKLPNSRAERSTLVNMAEQLLRMDYIDVDSVTAEIAADLEEKAPKTPSPPSGPSGGSDARSPRVGGGIDS